MIQAAMWIASVLFFVWLAWTCLKIIGPIIHSSWIRLKRSMITDDYYMLWGVVAVVLIITAGYLK